MCCWQRPSRWRTPHSRNSRSNSRVHSRWCRTSEWWRIRFAKMVPSMWPAITFTCKRIWRIRWVVVFKIRGEQSFIYNSYGIGRLLWSRPSTRRRQRARSIWRSAQRTNRLSACWPSIRVFCCCAPETIWPKVTWPIRWKITTISGQSRLSKRSISTITATLIVSCGHQRSLRLRWELCFVCV